jgi:hypothetical protein
MSISAANPGCDCHTVLYIVVTPGHSKSLRQELGQVKITSHSLFHKGGKAAMVPSDTIAYFSIKLNPFPFAIGTLLTHLDLLFYRLKTTT